MNKQIVLTIAILLYCALSFSQSFFPVSTPAIAGSDNKHFHFYSSSSINTTEDLTNSITASQKFSVLINMARKRRGHIGFDLYMGANLINLRPTSVKKDSVDIVSLMFPETGNAGFVFSPQIHWMKNGNHNLHSEASFSFRQTKVMETLADSSEHDFSFSILNYNIMPLVYVYDYSNDDFTGNLMLAPYINFFNIPNEDAVNFNRLFNETDPIFSNSRNSMIPSLGAKFQVSLNGFQFFADFRSNYTRQLLNDDNPYKGFVFNTGFNTTLKIFSK